MQLAPDRPAKAPKARAGYEKTKDKETKKSFKPVVELHHPTAAHKSSQLPLGRVALAIPMVHTESFSG